ncbi:ArsR/SmtB family transcription factor [Oricola sp.]|uniref:ArsR/SmtB family transcription factor n=1 Tax=Oricola sp. TaxID=1979950 RepID=UPI003BAA7071
MIDISDLEEKVFDASRLLEMMAHHQRLRILCLLMEGERSVLSLADATGLSQPAISHHLKKLRDAELVTTRRDAQTIYYSLNGNEVEAVLQTLHGLYCA